MSITQQQITGFLKDYENATNTHVFQNVSDLIHPDAFYRFTDGDFVGIDAIQKAFEDTWDAIQNETYTLTDISIITADTNSAAITYTFNWTGIVDGKQKSGKGRGTNIIVKNGEKLQFILEHLSK